MRIRGWIAALMTAAAIDAQTITGSIVGSVRDSSGAPVVSAAVSLVQTTTGAQRQARTDERGDFVFSSLQPGQYSLSIEVAGFKRLARREIQLSAAESLPLGALVLEVGSLNESVTVTAQGAAVQTASAERAGVVTSSQVDGLLIRGRNVVTLLQLLPGVVDLDDSERLQNNWNLYVQGNRRGTNWIQLDGMMTNGASNNFNATVNVSMDAVQEVKVLLTNYQAEYGRMSGANIQLVTKSGAREFHGMGSYFRRHEQFNANNFFNNRLGAVKPRYRYHTWSYNLGGPAYIPGKFNTGRDKLFFFWAQEYWPMKVPLALAQRTVPGELERKGDFSQSLDLNNRLITVKDPFSNGAPFPGNRVPAALLNASGLALLKVFPAPNFENRAISGGRYNYIFQTENTTPVRTETLRLDYNLNPNNIIFGNFTRRLDSQEGAMGLPTSGGTNWPQLRKKNVNDGHVVILRYQRIFSPTLINEANVGYTWRPWDDQVLEEEVRRNQRDQAGFTLGQFAPGINPLKMLPNASFGGVSNAANLSIEGRFPVLYREKNFSFTDNLTKTAGPHTIKAGVYMDRVWIHQAVALNFNGSFDFTTNVNNPLDSGYAYSNAALGVFNSYTEATGRPFPHFRVRNLEWFVQDNWKVTPRLTLDYGLRFAWLAPLFERDDLMSGFVPERYNLSRQVRLIEPALIQGKRVGVHPVTKEVYAANLIGSIAPGTGDVSNGLVATAADQAYPRALIDNRGVHYGPRIGFALDAFGNGSTAIRGGFGIFYNRQDVANALIPFTTQAPLVANPTYYFGQMGTLLSTSGLVSPQNVIGLSRAGHLPTVMNYSFSIQHKRGLGTLIDIGYVGSLGRHLMWQRNLNAVPFGTNFNPANNDPTTNRPFAPNFLRTYMGFGEAYLREWASSSNYHSLQVSAVRRYARGLQFGAVWTWSKSMDYNSDDTATISTLIPVRIANYGLSSFDRTHNVKLNWLWDVPKPPFHQPPLKLVLNDWQVSGIAGFVSGAPLAVGYTTTTSIDITGSPTDGARIDVTGNPVLAKSERTFSRNFRTEVFRLPALRTYGNSARSVIRGPGINNWDIAVFKSIPIREPFRLQFRWESYNAFNHTQFSALDTTARFDAAGNQVNSRLGEFTAARNPRQMQFALRLYF